MAKKARFICRLAIYVAVYSTRPALRLISRQKLRKLNDWNDNKLNKKFIIANKRMEKREKNLQSLQLCSANDHTLFRGFSATVKHNSAAQTCGIFKWNLWEFWSSCAAGKRSPVRLHRTSLIFFVSCCRGTMDLIKPNNTGEIKNLTPSELLLPSLFSRCSRERGSLFVLDCVKSFITFNFVSPYHRPGAIASCLFTRCTLERD